MNKNFLNVWIGMNTLAVCFYMLKRKTAHSHTHHVKVGFQHHVATICMTFLDLHVAKKGKIVFLNKYYEEYLLLRLNKVR